MKTKGNNIKAGKGKVLRRKSDKMIAGKELNLGYTYYLKGEKLDEPLLELPEHYEEIDEAEANQEIIIEPETPLIEEEVEEPRKITVADYVALEKKVEQLMKMINADIG